MSARRRSSPSAASRPTTARSSRCAASTSTCNQGEIVTLIGANGAGKSTLMMTICGNPRARDGSITFDGEDITRMPTHEIMRAGDLAGARKAAASFRA